MGNVPMRVVAPASRVPTPYRARAAAVSPGPHAEIGQYPSVRALTRRALTCWPATPPHATGSKAAARRCPCPAAPHAVSRPMSCCGVDRSVAHHLHMCPAIKAPLRPCSRGTQSPAAATIAAADEHLALLVPVAI
jgi:hypothetical protein